LPRNWIKGNDVKKKFFTWLIMYSLAMFNANSQPLFYSQSLQNLYYSLPQYCRLENPVADTVVHCSGILQGFTVPVAYSVDSYGVLVHVGYRFLPDSVDTQFFHLAVVKFLERETLALLVAGDLDQKLTNNRDNGLSLIYNGNTPRREFYRSRNGLPYLLQRVESMDIRYDDGQRYRVDLNCGQSQTLTFFFNADAELLSDMDKKERDERLAAQLSVHRAKTNDAQLHIPVCDYTSLQLVRDSLYVCPGSFYIMPQMNGNLYYLIDCDKPELVFSLTWASETFSNVMLASERRHDYTFRIAHRQYGGEILRYDLKSSDFYDYFSEDYDRFFSVESLERDILKGTLILADRSVGSIHLAFASVSLWELLNGGVMEIQLDTNIPQHNIETLFGRSRNNDNEKHELNIR